MFGYGRPTLCSTCHAGELADLSVPPDGDHVFRKMVIPDSCSRCGDWGVWPGSTSHKIYLPSRLVADARALSAKCRASALWGMKPANADLQLVNLVSTERDGRRANALLTVGLMAITDEESFAAPGFLGSCLEHMCCSGARSHAWRREDKLACTILESEREPYWFMPEWPGWPTSVPGVDSARPVDDAILADDSKVALAETAERIDSQQSAFRDGTTIISTVVEAPGTAGTSGQAVGAEVGSRVAQARFPSMSEKEAHCFSNDPRCLEAANTLRNEGVGVHSPSEKEAKARDEVVELLCDKVFTKRECEKAMMGYVSLTKTALPRKLSEEQKMQWQLDAMNAADGDGLSYSKFIDAFVKAEVSAKPKPRPIANHKEIRLCALAKVAWVYEHVIFHRLIKMSIKHRKKIDALRDIASALSGMKNGRWVENDLTAFEFGISATLKECECKILRHIASHIGIEDVGSLLFERVVNDRTKSCVWSMRYKDETGEKRTFRLVLPTAMRESGDRLTSSGNFLQNLIAWTAFLAEPGTIDKSIESLLRTQGARMFYTSARDGEKYLAMLVFEGDDTLGRLEEEGVWSPFRGGSTDSVADDFFYRWGWKPKLSWKATEGYDYARVVGYDILIRDGVAVKDGDSYVCCPEMKRLLTTKQWTTSTVTPEELKTCNRIFAATLATDFTKVEPFYAFLKAMYESNAGGKQVTDERVREHYLMMTGELPDHGSVKLSNIEFPDFDGTGSEEWKELARVSCGDFTDLEWATACAQPLHDRHGADVASHFPASWLG